MAVRVKLLGGSAKYERVRQRANVLVLQGGTAVLYRRTLILHLRDDFWGRDEGECLLGAVSRLESLLRGLEHDLGVLLVKYRYQNMRVFAAHFAEVGNELAVQARDLHEFISVRAEEDGRVWAQFDVSVAEAEAETLHPRTGFEDMGDVVRPFFNDLRDFARLNSRPVKISEVYNVIGLLSSDVREVATGLGAVVDLLKAQIPRPREGDGEDGQTEIPDYIA